MHIFYILGEFVDGLDPKFQFTGGVRLELIFSLSFAIRSKHAQTELLCIYLVQFNPAFVIDDISQLLVEHIGLLVDVELDPHVLIFFLRLGVPVADEVTSFDDSVKAFRAAD